MQKLQTLLVSIIVLLLVSGCKISSEDHHSPGISYLNISGIYPHLAAFNQPEDTALRKNHVEGGIGVVVPWAGKLWYLTYPPHQRTGSNDKLYMVDEEMNLTIRPESNGGTHANRLIHRESNQLLMGYYAIDYEGNVRTIDPHQLEGRMTATTRHLTDPANKVYYYDMEGMVYEMDVHTLAVNRLFEKPVPGWHGKGAYVGQGRLIVANNGEHQGHSMAYSKLLVGGEAQTQEEAGVLAEWDGKEWRIIERKQFTDVTGPGGIYGNNADTDPVWSMGWDKRSVILKLLDNGEWYTYRLPKASHTFDPRHGWFTEWPRIREIAPDQLMMVMHGTMFHFPKTFSRANSSGIFPITTHLRYIPDFCHWNGKVILSADDASSMQNPIVGQAQSNLWWGTVDELNTFGPKSGWGGIWVKDQVKAGVPSDPYLAGGYTQRALHLTHNASKAVSFLLETDEKGDGNWKLYRTIEVPAMGYVFESLPEELSAAWLRITAEADCEATAYFHYFTPRIFTNEEKQIFAGLADVGEPGPSILIRPAGHNRSLQVLTGGEAGKYIELALNESGTDLVFEEPAENRSAEVLRLAAKTKTAFATDAASVIVTDDSGNKYRLPKGPEVFDLLGATGYLRAIREVQSERYLANIHGMFYEVPRAEGAGNHTPDYQKIKPVSRHDKMIPDYCSWRGLLVLAGVKSDAPKDGHTFTGAGTGLWFGAVDDLWKLGKPTGVGGPWKDTEVVKGKASDPYLMTGFDRKRVSLSHNLDQTVHMTLEVAITPETWQVYKVLDVPAGSALNYTFPEGFHAYWVRVRSDHNCRASAIFTYE
ncbi:MAG: hypothetical protein R3D00_08610 [Bacteroidia bacterium]